MQLSSVLLLLVSVATSAAKVTGWPEDVFTIMASSEPNKGYDPRDPFSPPEKTSMYICPRWDGDWCNTDCTKVTEFVLDAKKYDHRTVHLEKLTDANYLSAWMSREGNAKDLALWRLTAGRFRLFERYNEQKGWQGFCEPPKPFLKDNINKIKCPKGSKHSEMIIALLCYQY